jgi:hypothetical protein
VLRRERAILVPSDTVCLLGQGRGRKLATEELKPVGSGRFRDHSQDPIGVLGMSFSSSLALSEEGCVAKTHRGHEGYEVALLAQLRLPPLETSSKSILPFKRILFPAPHSVPCSPFARTDVPSSQYRLPWACVKRPLTCASSTDGRAPDATAAGYLVER